MSKTVTGRVIATIATLAMIAGFLSPLSSSVVEAAVIPSCTVVSNTSVQEGGSNSFTVPELPGPWTSISGANWIWGDEVSNAPASTQTFTKKFIVNGTPTLAELQFAVDNKYTITVNGESVGNDTSAEGLNFGSITTLNITSKLIANAENTLEFKVENLDGPGNNPAGLLFKLSMTGNTCEPLPVDQCSNIHGMQERVPGGYTAVEGDCYPVTVTEGTSKVDACVVKGENLVRNGSFEEPIISNGYSVVPNIVHWLSSSPDGFEIWRNQNGPASQGAQHVELDVNQPTTISQLLPTVAGNEYQVTFDFSPRSGGNAADNKVEVAVGSVLGSVSADGTAYSANVWTTHNFQFTATNTSSLLELRDKGVTTAGEGTLIDNVKVCLIKDNVVIEPNTYEIFGFVWDDTDEDDVREGGEDNLEGWTVRATQQLVEGKPIVITDTTDASGRYSLYVPAGTWVVEQLTEEGWTLLSIGNNGDGTYVVVVPVPEEISELSFLNWLIPTAHAAAFAAEDGPFNFGNDQIEERRSGGSGGGTRVGDRNPQTPPGEVLGSSISTPTGVVLGEATTTMPVGAPNTGAGGTAPIAVSLPTLVAILSTTTRKSK